MSYCNHLTSVTFDRPLTKWFECKSYFITWTVLTEPQRNDEGIFYKNSQKTYNAIKHSPGTTVKCNIDLRFIDENSVDNMLKSFFLRHIKTNNTISRTSGSSAAATIGVKQQ